MEEKRYIIFESNLNQDLVRNFDMLEIIEAKNIDEAKEIFFDYVENLSPTFFGQGFHLVECVQDIIIEENTQNGK